MPEVSKPPSCTHESYTSAFDHELKLQFDRLVTLGRHEQIRRLVRAVVKADSNQMSRRRKLDVLAARLPAPLAEPPQWYGLVTRMCAEPATREQYEALRAYLDEIFSADLSIDEMVLICVGMHLAPKGPATAAQRALQERHPEAAAVIVTAILESPLEAAQKDRLINAIAVKPASVIGAFSLWQLREDPWTVLMVEQLDAAQAQVNQLIGRII
jgi:hypothetical protein